MSGSITEAVFVLGEIERDLATARRWLKDHGDELTEAGVSHPRIDDVSVRPEDPSARTVGDTALAIRLMTLSRRSFASAARVLAKGAHAPVVYRDGVPKTAGRAGVTKAMEKYSNGAQTLYVTRTFGRVLLIVWCPHERVCEPISEAPYWDYSGFERLLAGATS